MCVIAAYIIITDSRTLEPFVRVGALSLVELLLGTPWVHTSEASERPVAHKPSQEVVFARGPLLVEQKIAIHLLDRWGCFWACPNYISVISLTYSTRRNPNITNRCVYNIYTSICNVLVSLLIHTSHMCLEHRPQHRPSD